MSIFPLPFRAQIPDVVVVRARFPRLVFELRVMGEGGFPPVVFPQPLTPQVILYEGATLNVAVVTDCFPVRRL